MTSCASGDFLLIFYISQSHSLDNNKLKGYFKFYYKIFLGDWPRQCSVKNQRFGDDVIDLMTETELVSETLHF
jgi:hypothetical protein